MAELMLVVYGTRNGSTQEIAESIGNSLRTEGLAVDVRPAADVRDVCPYSAVVVGGGLYANRWHRDARRFVRRHRRPLGDRSLWLFSSGPLDPSAGERDIPPVPGVRRIADRLGARGHATFGGRLDDTATGRLARMIVKSGKGGDFRDFGKVTAWASGIADALAGEEVRRRAARE
ncbi:flavodoxin domain-containing protein [Streptomyces xanthochromogenes]|uniref:flavodoxin domain-containing protein n=1 Tax=Streptomyces xanthochromogenes TaxID=67384 RepID=UPI0037F5F5ED